MQIREANATDAKDIKNLYLQAFDESESELVSSVAVNLLHEKPSVKIISLVALDNETIISHIAFSPVFLISTNEHFGYILAPLAVAPSHQKNSVGSKMVKHGLDIISSLGPSIVFVYGDPRYYSRFGFKTNLGKKFSPPYTLQYPEGWHALKINTDTLPDGGNLKCVNALNNSNLW